MNRTVIMLALAVGWSALGVTARSADEPRGRKEEKSVKRDAPRGEEAGRPERGRPERDEGDRAERPERPERPPMGPRGGDRDIDGPPPFARNRGGDEPAVCPHCKRGFGDNVRGPQARSGLPPWGQARGNLGPGRAWGPSTDGRRQEMGPMARRGGDRQVGPRMGPGFGPSQGSRGFGWAPQGRSMGPGSRLGQPGAGRLPWMRSPSSFGQGGPFGSPMRGGRPQAGPQNRGGGDRQFGPPSMRGNRPPIGPMGPQGRGQAFRGPGQDRPSGPPPFAQRFGRGARDEDEGPAGRPPMGPPGGDRRGPPGRPDFN